MSETTAPTTEARGRRKVRQGVVVGTKAQKTAVVEVTRRVKHGVYGKYINLRKKIPVHDLIGCEVGDLVRIEETRPISKTKHWRVLEKLSKDS